MITQQLLLSFKNNNAAIDENGESITYGELDAFSEKLYAVIGHRCLVLCLCKNQLGSFSGYVSFLSKKMVPLLLADSLDNESLKIMVHTYRPEFIWLPKEKAQEIKGPPVVFEAFNYVLIKCGFPNSFPLHDQLALLFTTSGSTGSPKLVRISYQNIQSNAESIAEYLSITEKERPITSLPMNYSYGLSVINSHILKGATVLLTDSSVMEKTFWTFLKNEKATSLSGVPYTYEMLAKLRFSKMDIPSLTTLTQAGGKLSEKLCSEFGESCKESDKRFFVMYGQTEATARMSYLSPEMVMEKPGSIGKPIRGGSFQLVDENNLPVTDNDTVGELVYTGNNVSMGYAENGDDLQKEDENKGILYTGDLARKDKDGFYYIVGRKKRFIKLFGNRIGLDEAEQMLKNIIPDCACTGVDDRMVIYITDPSKETQVYEFMTHKTGIHRSAFHVKCIDIIPKNASGKTIYTNLSVA